MKRVLGVLEDILKDKKYLVGEKATYADLSFVTWNWVVNLFPDFAGWKTEFPSVAAWHERLEKRESVQKILADKEALKKA